MHPTRSGNHRVGLRQTVNKPLEPEKLEPEMRRYIRYERTVGRWLRHLLPTWNESEHVVSLKER